MAESHHDDDDNDAVLMHTFECQFCQEPFEVARSEWEAKNKNLHCPKCGKLGNYGLLDIRKESDWK